MNLSQFGVCNNVKVQTSLEQSRYKKLNKLFRHIHISISIFVRLVVTNGKQSTSLTYSRSHQANYLRPCPSRRLHWHAKDNNNESKDQRDLLVAAVNFFFLAEQTRKLP